jgi:predicted transcriptional regulator of viral defense system
MVELENRGLLRRVRRGVYLVEPGRAPSPQEDILSAWLALNRGELPWQHRDPVPSEIVSHASAAALHGLGTIIPGLPELTVNRPVNRPDIRSYAHRMTPEDWEWMRIDDGVRVPVTTRARTIIDLLLANEEMDYLERAARQSFPDAKTARQDLYAAASRRLKRSKSLKERVARLIENAW